MPSHLGECVSSPVLSSVAVMPITYSHAKSSASSLHPSLFWAWVHHPMNRHQGSLATHGRGVPLTLFLLAMCIPFCYAVSLPAVINESSFAVPDEAVVDSAGTTLDVPAMLGNASYRGKSAADFSGTRLVFKGTLSIALPNSSSEWTMPLFVVILNGSSGAPWPTLFIRVTGALGSGSNISIKGGVYDYTVMFMYFPVGATLRDGSIIAILGGTYRAHLPNTTDSTYLLYSEAGLSIANRSTLCISDNKMDASDLAVAMLGWSVFSVHSEGPVFLFQQGVLAISNNGVSISNLSLEYFYVYTIHSASFSVVADSTLSISSNVLHVSNVSVMANFDLFTLYGNSATLVTVGINGVLNISHNDMDVSGLSGDSLQWLLVFIPSLRVSNKSAFYLSNNNMGAINASIITSCKLNGINTHTGSCSISNESVFSISDNTMTVNATVSDSWELYFMQLNSEIIVQQYSSFFVSRNKITTTNVTVSANFNSAMLFSYSLITVNTSSIVLTNGNAFTADVNKCDTWELHIVFFFKSVSIQSEGSLTISNNTVDLFDVKVAGTLRLHVFRVQFALSVIAIDAGGAVSLISNTLQWSGKSNGATIQVFSLGVASITVDGHMKITDNVLWAESSTSITQGMASFSGTVAGSGTVQLYKNQVVANLSSPDFLMMRLTGTFSAIHPTLSSCRNYANGLPCIMHFGNYSCAAGSNLVGRLHDCTVSQTVTSTITISRVVTQSRLSSTASGTWDSHTSTSTLSLPKTSKTQSSINDSRSLSTSPSASPASTMSVSGGSQSTSPSALPASTASGGSSSTESLKASSTLSIHSLSSSKLQTGSGPTHTVTPSLLPSITPCNYSCSDIVGLHRISRGTTPQQAISMYLGSTTAFPSEGCTPTTLPFKDTANGGVGMVLVHIAVPTAGMNTSYLFEENALYTTMPGVVLGTGLAVNITTHGLVLVVGIRRVDPSPTSTVSCSIVFPQGLFMCLAEDSSHRSLPIEGLPWVNIDLAAPPPPLSEGERTAVAALSIASADLQTVAAIGLLRCSPGSDHDLESEAGIRALVPVALSGTCEGAVQGALMAIGVAAFISAVAMSVVKAVKGLSWMDAAAMTRCPGIVIAVWAFLQMGLVVCGARLVTAEGGGNIDLGILGIVVGSLLPIVCVALAWGVVSRRCYQLAQTPKAMMGRHWIVVWVRTAFLPGYELDMDVYPMSKALSSVVGRSRRPSCLWSGLPVIQPIVMLLVAFVKGDSCNVFLIVSGVMLLMVALVHALFRPHRILTSNYFQSLAMALNAAVLFVASSLVRDPLNQTALDANGSIALVQMALSICRFVHMGGCLLYMRLYGAATLAICGSEAPSQPHPVFDVHSLLCVQKKQFIPPCRQLSTPNSIDGISKTFTQSLIEASCSSAGSDTPSTPSGSTARPRQDILPTSVVTSPVDDEDPDALLASPAASSLAEGADDTTAPFEWNPKGHVPMERPYTFLWKQDFTPVDDEDDTMMDIISQKDSVSSTDSDRSLRSLPGANYHVEGSSTHKHEPFETSSVESHLPSSFATDDEDALL